MGCKLLLILDDLLWVLTDSQLKAVLHFIDSLSDLVQRATESTRKKKAARKLEVCILQFIVYVFILHLYKVNFTL